MDQCWHLKNYTFVIRHYDAADFQLTWFEFFHKSKSNPHNDLFLCNSVLWVKEKLWNTSNGQIHRAWKSPWQPQWCQVSTNIVKKYILGYENLLEPCCLSTLHVRPVTSSHTRCHQEPSPAHLPQKYWPARTQKEREREIRSQRGAWRGETLL